MKSKLPACLALVVMLLAFSGPALAHHGSAAYEAKVVEMKNATVTKFTWSNPHALVLFDVMDDKGSVVHWAAEIGSPPAVAVLGWTRTSLKPGDVVTVFLWPAKSRRPVGRMNRVVFPDGRTLRDSQLGGGEGEGENKY